MSFSVSAAIDWCRSVGASLRTARGRVSLGGGDLRLKPKRAVALSMALNELGTNALKYGALSTERGAVTVRWTTDDGERRSAGRGAQPPRLRLAYDRARAGRRAAERGEHRLTARGRDLHHRRAARRHPRARRRVAYGAGGTMVPAGSAAQWS